MKNSRSPKGAKMKIIIFGTGVYYDLRKQNIKNYAEIVAFIDNDSNLWWKEKDGITILPPNFIKQLEYDYIVLMSLNTFEMKQQLLNLKVEQDKIKFYEDFRAYLCTGKLEIFYKDTVFNQPKGKILITIPILGYHGVSMVAINSAKALINKGYNVVLAAADKDNKIIDEVIGNNIPVIIYGGLYTYKQSDFFWLKDFDYVIINSYRMINFASKVSFVKPCIWWLHEPVLCYEKMFEQFKDISIDSLQNLHIYAVSNIAKNSFNEYYPSIKVNLLEYGIPDTKKYFLNVANTNKIIFAIIGYVSEIKAQDIFIEAIQKLTETERQKAEFWIIGSIGKNSFCQKIFEKSLNKPYLKIMGEIDRNTIEQKYSEIDVVVNCSRYDSFPVVVAEGMMHGKICITSEATGMAPYIKDKENGFICKTEDSNSLCSKIRWILSHKEKLMEISKNARVTFEKNFTLENFASKLDYIINHNL